MSDKELIQSTKKRKLNDGSCLETQEEVTDTYVDLVDSTDPEPREIINGLYEATNEPKRHTKALTESVENAKDSNDSTENVTVSQDKLRNFVTQEDVDQLRQFHVLDEVKSNDEDSNDENSEDSDGKPIELPEDELEMMLEADLPDEIKGAPKMREKAYVTIQKTILEEKGVNHFEVLPMDWIMVRHMSGMPIFMHRFTRVCTLSKPYFLGKNNTRRHDIPISAIPCYAYRRALEEEEKQKEIDKSIEDQIRKHSSVIQNSNGEAPSLKNIQTFTSSQASNADLQLQGNLVESELPSININPESVLKVDKKSSESSNSMDSECNPCAQLNTEIPNEEASLTTEGNLETELVRMSPYNSTFAEDVNFQDQNSFKNAKCDLTAELNKDALKANAVQTETQRKCPYIHTSTETTVTKDTVPPGRKPVILPGGIVMPPPRVETLHSSWKTQQLTPEQLNDYCKRLFKFKEINYMHFKRWADRRKYTKGRKTMQYPTLPEGSKLITIPAQPSEPGQDSGGRANKRDWVMNMNDRSYLSVFHEYVGRALQKQPVYHFKQLENAAQPYQAVVTIGGMQYGVGYGTSKRQAKSAAARASIHILMPEVKDELDKQDPGQKDKGQAADIHQDFFDLVSIEDPRISELCAATCEPSPHAVLRTCLLRNLGAPDQQMHIEMKKLEFQKIELTMKVGKHSATVVCKNKKMAKQRASQTILQALHPHVRSWGSLLRLYGSRSMKSCQEKKLEQQQITLLQDKAKHNQPNHAVLQKLREEMRKLKERDDALAPIGSLLLQHDLPTAGGSNLNNVEI